MSDISANPIYVALLFILRCLVPLAVLFGISYLLRKMGFVAVEAPEPPDEREDDEPLINKAKSISTRDKETRKPGGTKASSKKNRRVEEKTSGKHPDRRKTVEKPRSRSK